MSSWANSFTGSNRFGGQDFDQLRFKGLLANYFQEKADLASVKLFPVAFHTLTAEEFNSHFLEAFKTLYKRNSANVAKVLSFLEFFGREFFKKMSVDQLKEMLSPKIFEAINHKDEPIVISGIKTVQFFASLNKPELNDLLVQQAFPSIEKRNIELVKVMGLQLCFGLVLTSPASIKATYNLLNSALEQIKTEEYKVKLVQQFDKTSLCMAKRISSLEHLDVLLTSKGSDFNTSMRMILARHLIEVHAKEDSKMESAQESISECYTTFVQRSLVENPSRVKCGNLETLAACVLVTKFSKITGKLTAETEKIAGALASKDLEYFTEAFYKNNPPIFKSLLFELLVELDTKLKHQQKYLDIVLGSLVVDRTFCQTKILDGHKLSQAFAISCLRGVRVLYQWRGTKPHIEDFLSCSMQSLASGGTLSTEDAHTVLHVVSLQKKAVLLAQKLNSTLLQAQATSLYTNALKFPQDVLKPIDYHYLGSEGLFSLHQDKQAYYRAYVAMLINIDIDVFFKNSSIFYEEAELRDMRLVYSRNSMVCNRNLDIEDRSFTESYRDVLEHLSFLKKEKKTKKKDEPTEPEVRTIPLDYKVAGDLALKLAKEDAVYSEYAFYLRRISESAADAFSVIQESKTEKSLALMESIKQFNLFAKLKAIARDIEPLRESVQSLLEAILKGLTLSIADASFGDKFSKLYFQVISSQRATQFNRTLEELLQNIFEVKEDANIHSAAIPIIQDFSKYCFEYMYDADNRRKSYDIILCMARKEPSNFLYEFLKESLDDLYYFDGIIETLNDTVVTLGKSDKSILSGFLLKLLEYQNPAQKTFLTSVLQLDEAVMKQQDFGNFEKIKLLIVTKGESPENAGLAVQVLARIGHVLEIHQILELDFLRMVNEIPFDLHEVTGNILRDSLQKMKVSDKVSFFKMLIENCTKHTQEYTAKVKDFEDHPDDEKKQINYKEVEELLGIYPMILSCLAPIWEEEMFEPVFDMIISLENNHLPGLTQKFCDAGITFVNTHHKHSKKLLDIFEARLKHREGVVAPLVLLGAAAKFVNKKGSKLDLISDKIMGLTDSTDPVFQKKLGMNMSRLLIFFEDPAQVIEGLLSRVAEEKDTAKIRGKCFSIAGLLRGQGAVFIQKHYVLGRIQAIVGLVLPRSSPATRKTSKTCPSTRSTSLCTCFKHFG